MKRLKVFDPEQLDVTFTFEVDEREGTVKRILCPYCPEHKIERTPCMVISYCEIASKLREEGILK